MTENDLLKAAPTSNYARQLMRKHSKVLVLSGFAVCLLLAGGGLYLLSPSFKNSQVSLELDRLGTTVQSEVVKEETAEPDGNDPAVLTEKDEAKQVDVPPEQPSQPTNPPTTKPEDPVREDSTESTESEPTPAPPLSTTYTGSSCSVDGSSAADLAEFTQKIGVVCDKEYPVLLRELAGTVRPVQLVLKGGMQNAGEASGTTISLSIDWFRSNPTDTGAIVHELVHVAQAYPAGGTFWLVEGIADYYRYKLGYANSWSYAHCGSGSEHYTSGYWCAAALLTFLESQTSGTMGQLNQALREGTYSDSDLQTMTGKSLEEQWHLCLQSTCQGGRAS